MTGPVRIGNCSGFYGDRLSAMREMLEGGPLDVLTGDYLAELTMLILGRDTLRDPSLGYARTFVRQAEDCLGLALERGVRIVSNAGGLNPAGLAARLREVAEAQGLSPRIAWVDGDDLAPQAAAAEPVLPASARSALAELADLIGPPMVFGAEPVDALPVAPRMAGGDDLDPRPRRARHP